MELLIQLTDALSDLYTRLSGYNSSVIRLCIVCVVQHTATYGICHQVGSGWLLVWAQWHARQVSSAKLEEILCLADVTGQMFAYWNTEKLTR